MPHVPLVQVAVRLIGRRLPVATVRENLGGNECPSVP
jgi:hypothetical protein